MVSNDARALAGQLGPSSSGRDRLLAVQTYLAWGGSPWGVLTALVVALGGEQLLDAVCADMALWIAGQVAQLPHDADRRAVLDTWLRAVAGDADRF